MSDDQLFRLLLLIGFAGLLPIGAYHRLKAGTDEKLDRRQEGLFILITLRLIGIIGALGLVAYLINPTWMTGTAIYLPASLRWVGVGIAIAGGLLVVWTFTNLGKNLTDTVVTRKEHTLVTTGPFRWIRHPFYTAAALLIPGSFLITANWFFLVAGGLVFLLLAIRTPKEEANLITRFGDEYRTYQQRTGRYLPRSLRHFAKVLLALAIVVAGSYLLNRLLAERNAVVIRSTNSSARQAATQFDGTLRLATFNIAHGRGTNESNHSHAPERWKRLKEIAEFLQRQDLDIVILNEVDFASVWTGHENQAEIIAKQAGFTHVMEQRNFDMAIPFLRLRFGNAILSRFPIRSAQLVRLPVHSGFEQRFAGAKQSAFADIQLDNQLTIRVFPVHLEPRAGLTRSNSTAVLASWITNSPYPVICLGDFNCWPTAFSKDRSRSADSLGMDFLLREGRLQTRTETQLLPGHFTFTSYAPSEAIDWILVPANWEFTSYEVHDIQLSDHRPVVAEVRVKR